MPAPRSAPNTVRHDPRRAPRHHRKSLPAGVAGIFYSTIIIVASFLPVFLLTGQEGKLFHPLAWTKTFILLIDALMAMTVAPVLLSFFLKGKFKPEEQNPLGRFLERLYAPLHALVPALAQNHPGHQHSAAASAFRCC